MNIVLIDSTFDSLTVSWPAVPGATRYILQYRRGGGEDVNKEGDGDKQEGAEALYETLSENLTSTQARKRNLADASSSSSSSRNGFFFRVRAVTPSAEEQDSRDEQWISHNEPFHLLTADQENNRIKAPIVITGVGNHTALIRWEGKSTAAKPATSDPKPFIYYELQMRENDGGVSWSTIAPSFRGTEVRKKNLISKHGYQFRVRPVVDDSNNDDDEKNTTAAFSSPSNPIIAPGLSNGIQRLFQGLQTNEQLLRNPNKTHTSLQDALGGKEFILLYASAHWCPPCRQYTPRLIQWYNSIRKGMNNVEIVFLSADHDKTQFDSYYVTMPWCVVPYDDPVREGLLNYIKVTGIPRLVVLDGRTGKILVDNAVGQALDVVQWRRLATTTGGG